MCYRIRIMRRHSPAYARRDAADGAAVAAWGTRAILLVGVVWGALCLADSLGVWRGFGGWLRAVIDAWVATNACSGTEIFRRLGGMTMAACFALGGLVMGLGAGGFPASFLSARPLSLALVIPLGLGILSATVAGLGFAGLLSSLLLKIVALGALIPGIRAIWLNRASLAGSLRSFAGEPVSVILAVIMGAVAWVVIASFPDALEDPFVYHWAAPEHFLQQHRLVGTPWHIQWHYPLGVEMLYAIGLSLGGIVGIKGLNLAMLAASLVGVHALTRRLGGSGWPAVALLALAPGIAGHVSVAKNDLGLLMFWTAAMLVPLELPIRSVPAVAAAGAFAGLCVSVKYTSLYPLAGLLVWLLYRRPGIRALAGLGSAAAAVCAVWLFRNWFVTGNPLFPYATRLFDGIWWGPEYEQAVKHYSAEVTTWVNRQPSYWLFAWRDTFGSTPLLGPILAALAPLGICAFLPPAGRAACAAAVITFLALLTERNCRFLLPLLALAAAAGALALDGLRAKWPRPFARAWPFILAWAAVYFGLGMSGVLTPDGVCWFAGRMTGGEYLSARYSSYDAFRRWCAENLPAGSRILLAGNPRRFGFKQAVVSTAVVACPMPWKWAKESRTADELAKRWRQAGITHVASDLLSGRYRSLNWFPGPDWDDRMLRLYRAFALRHLAEVHHSPAGDDYNGIFYLLRFDRRGHAPARFISVLPWTEKVFAAAYRQSMSMASREDRIAVFRRVLDRFPDVDSEIEYVGDALFSVDDYAGALPLYRLVCRHGFDGEGGWSHLALLEGADGNTRAAFAAVRHLSRARPLARLEPILASIYYNWSVRKERSGDAAGACRMLSVSLGFSPDLGPARTAAARLGCRGLPSGQ